MLATLIYVEQIMHLLSGHVVAFGVYPFHAVVNELPENKPDHEDYSQIGECITS